MSNNSVSLAAINSTSERVSRSQHSACVFVCVCESRFKFVLVMSSLFRCMRHVACRVAHTREHFRCEFPEKTGFHSFRLFRANLETAIGVFANASPFLVRHSSFFGGMKNEDRLDFRLADARHKRGVSQPFRLNNRVRKCKCFAREPHTRPGRMEIAGIFRWVFITFTNLPHCYGIERSHEIWQMVARGKQANDGN